MKNFYIVLLALFFTTLSFSKNTGNGNNGSLYISEIKYEGVEPFIEFGAVGNGQIQLKDYVLELYNTSGVSLKKIPLTGKFKEGNFSHISLTDFSSSNLGSVSLVKNDDTVMDFLSFGAISTYGKSDESTYIGKASGENSIQRMVSGGDVSSDWIVASATKGTSNASKSLSVVKDQIEGFNVYPNPVSNGNISISSKNSLDKHVVIYSVLGSVVYEKAVSPNEVINVHNLSTGLYFVQVEEDKKVSVRKILVN